MYSDSSLNLSPMFQSSDSARRSLFHLCLAAEQAPARLETYRDRLVCLQKVRFSAELYDSFPDFCREAALLHLSGMLCVNFSPLWDPVIEIIASFAGSSNVKHFWTVFSELLNSAAREAGNDRATATGVSVSGSCLSSLNVK